MHWHPQRGTLRRTGGLTPLCTPGAWQGLVGSLLLGRTPSIAQRPCSSSPGQADPARAWEWGPKPRCWLGPSSLRALGWGRSGKTSGAGTSNKAREPSQLHPAAAPPPRPSSPLLPQDLRSAGSRAQPPRGCRHRGPGAGQGAGSGRRLHPSARVWHRVPPGPPGCACPRRAGVTGWMGMKHQGGVHPLLAGPRPSPCVPLLLQPRASPAPLP